MIWCIWYPSGGFGHYINAVLSLHAGGFMKPTNTEFQFGYRGESHDLPLVAPKYSHEPDDYVWEFAPGFHHTVLIDNGIHNESKKFLTHFPLAKVAKLCYTDWSWPIIAQTMIVKAMHKDFSSQVDADQDRWEQSSADWAKREKYFLYLRDHEFRSGWRPEVDCVNIDINDIYDYNKLRQILGTISDDLQDFRHLHSTWQKNNKKYFEPVLLAHGVLKSLRSGYDHSLSQITDLWSQAVINYFIWLEYDYEIPANDYDRWFSNTSEIYDLLHR